MAIHPWPPTSQTPPSSTSQLPDQSANLRWLQSLPTLWSRELKRAVFNLLPHLLKYNRTDTLPVKIPTTKQRPKGQHQQPVRRGTPCYQSLCLHQSASTSATYTEYKTWSSTMCKWINLRSAATFKCSQQTERLEISVTRCKYKQKYFMTEAKGIKGTAQISQLYWVYFWCAHSHLFPLKTKPVTLLAVCMQTGLISLTVSSIP